MSGQSGEDASKRCSKWMLETVLEKMLETDVDKDARKDASFRGTDFFLNFRKEYRFFSLSMLEMEVRNGFSKRCSKRSAINSRFSICVIRRMAPAFQGHGSTSL